MSAGTELYSYSHAITVPVFGKIPLHPRDIIRDLKQKEKPPLWAQFFKYGICGVFSVVILLAIVLFVEWQWPNYLTKDTTIIDTATRQKNMTIVLVCGFLPSNFFAYFTNRLFVFTPGKHSFMREATIFTVISGISFAGGEIGKQIMIAYAFPALVAAISFAISSALVNFVARKFIIFKN